VQLDTYERRLTKARANQCPCRCPRLSTPRKQGRAAAHELRDVHAASAAQRRELEDSRRESKMQKEQLAEAQEENIRHLACIVELEENLQVKASPVPTSDAENLEVEGVSCEGTLDVLSQVTIVPEAAASGTS